MRNEVIKLMQFQIVCMLLCLLLTTDCLSQSWNWRQPTFRVYEVSDSIDNPIDSISFNIAIADSKIQFQNLFFEELDSTFCSKEALREFNKFRESIDAFYSADTICVNTYRATRDIPNELAIFIIHKEFYEIILTNKNHAFYYTNLLSVNPVKIEALISEWKTLKDFYQTPKTQGSKQLVLDDLNDTEESSIGYKIILYNGQLKAGVLGAARFIKDSIPSDTYELIECLMKALGLGLYGGERCTKFLKE